MNWLNHTFLGLAIRVAQWRSVLWRKRLEDALDDAAAQNMLADECLTKLVEIDKNIRSYHAARSGGNRHAD